MSGEGHLTEKATMRMLTLCMALLTFPLATRAEEMAERIDRIVQKNIPADGPGCSIAVIRHGKIVYEQGYGLANIERKIENTPQTVFEIASMSKQFTAMCIALLAEEGKLSLDDSVRKYLPELHACAEPVKLSNLVHHTGGFPDYMDLMGDDPWTMENALKVLSKVKRLQFAPGEKFDYSNTGYVLLAWVVQRASGVPLREFAERRIFRPLGMEHTVIRDSKEVRPPHRAVGYDKKKGGEFDADMALWNYIVGDGSVLTTVEDFALWDGNFYHNKLGKGTEGLIDTVLTTGRLNNGKDTHYAFGLELGRFHGIHYVRHEGLWAGYGTDGIRFPDKELSVVCFANEDAIPSDQIDDKIAEALLSGEFNDRSKESK